MGIRDLIIRRWKILIIALAVALVIAGGYYLWVTRGAGRAAGIYITGDGGGYVVIERSWIPGQLRVRAGMINLIDGHTYLAPNSQSGGVHAVGEKSPPIVHHMKIKATYRHGQLRLFQRMVFQYQPDSNPYNSDPVDLHLVLTPSSRAGDWGVSNAWFNVMIRKSYEKAWISRSYWGDFVSARSWKDVQEVMDFYVMHHEIYALDPGHGPMPHYLHRIDDPRLVEYMRHRLERSATREDLDLLRRIVADHRDDPLLRLHLMELESDHGDLEKALTLYDQVRNQNADVEDILMRNAIEKAHKHVLSAVLKRDYPDLDSFAEAFNYEVKTFRLLKTLQQNLDWYRKMSGIDGFLMEPQPFVTAAYDPYRTYDAFHPWFLSVQTMSAVVRVFATLELFEGRRPEALDLLSGIYRTGQSMCADGMLFHRGIGHGAQVFSIDGLRIYALNACETPKEIQAFRQRLARLDHVPIQARGDSIYSDELPGLLGQIDWSEYYPYLRKPTRWRMADAKWACLLMSAAAWESLLTTGAFPKSEADFAALFDDGLPLDPFAAEPSPLRFVSAANECVVYSVGPDQIDGHTQIEFDPSNGTMSGGDVLVRVPREREYPFPREGVHAANAEELLSQFPNGLPLDPFADTKMRPLSIMESDAGHPVRIFSFGPDGDQQDYLGGYLADGKGAPVLYRDKLSQAGITIDPAYDPTNGVPSNGDLFMDLPR